MSDKAEERAGGTGREAGPPVPTPCARHVPEGSEEAVAGRALRVTLVAAVGTNGVIGRAGGLPWPPTGDLARFKRLTMGHVLVMGRRTYESIGRPLPGRTTVVLTRSQDWPPPPGVIFCAEVDEALRKAAAVDPEVFVAGGAQVYRATLPHADRMVLTLVDAAPAGDTYFPDVDWSQWRELAREPDDGFTIVTYERAVP